MGVCSLGWYRMNSPGYTNKGESDGVEEEEFSINMAEIVTGLIGRFQPEETVFAMDSKPYWREKVFTDFYSRHSEVYKEEIEGETTYYLVYDKKYFMVKYYKELGKFNTKKVSLKADRELLEERMLKDELTGVEGEDIPKGIKDLIPTYKGNRKGKKWDFDTTKGEYYKLCQRIAVQLAETHGCKVVGVEGAEADDVAYVYYQHNTASDLMYVTRDSDWTQIAMNGLFLKLFDPQTREFKELIPEKIKCDLAKKIMSGDAKDNIANICEEGKANWGEKKAEAKILDVGVDNIHEWLRENVQPAYLKRNYQLIYLANCPKKLQKLIVKEIEKKPRYNKDALTLEKYGLDVEDILSINLQAESDREMDIAKGIYVNGSDT